VRVIAADAQETVAAGRIRGLLIHQSTKVQQINGSERHV